MLPTVDFCGLNPTRLLIGANPFGGYSHQSKERDEEMRSYYTPDRIIETWNRAEAAGINTMVTNNETPHVLEALKEYLGGGGKLQWIAQTNIRFTNDMLASIDDVIEIGCKAIYFHGGLMDTVCAENRREDVQRWFEHAKQADIPVGSAGHDPNTHKWLHEMDLLDFHVVPFFNCGSVHSDGGEKFSLFDIKPAVEFIQSVQKPCIAYKIMGAGRLEARMAFDFAYHSIKPTDVVNVGMHRGDKDGMVEENVETVRAILAEQ